MTAAYYGEPDPFAAAWLRELMRAGVIDDGVVDERSIEDVTYNDIKDFIRVHFFAGIGVWNLALRRAGWPEDRRTWTGSCPCQPFSAAGKRKGFADERHKWPAFNHLIEIGRPETVFGEQVASPDGLAWLDVVRPDLEGKDYAFAAQDICAAGFGAPQIRQRLYWAADADYEGPQGRSEPERQCSAELIAGQRGVGGGLADADQQDRSGRRIRRPGEGAGANTGAARERLEGLREDRWSDATNGFWRASDWLGCRDDKWRPVEPGTFPLVDGAPNRVGRLRGYGNTIVAPQAIEFVKSVMIAKGLSEPWE